MWLSSGWGQRELLSTIEVRGLQGGAKTVSFSTAFEDTVIKLGHILACASSSPASDILALPLAHRPFACLFNAHRVPPREALGRTHIHESTPWWPHSRELGHQAACAAMLRRHTGASVASMLWERFPFCTGSEASLDGVISTSVLVLLGSSIFSVA